MKLSLRATQFVADVDGDAHTTVDVRALSHSYGSGESRKQVLFDNSLQIRRGEIIIITGPSGSGKTTLLTLIGTLRRVQEGELHVLGQPLHQASHAALVQLRRRLGFIFQSHNLFASLSALQNVRMALEMTRQFRSRNGRNQRAREMLEALGLGDRARHKPYQLSGGQKQRVAIARGLVHRPELVLADEPTAALDEQSGRAVVTLFQQLARDAGVTILMVTHDNRILDVADRIVNLVDGRIRSDVQIREASMIGEMLSRCSVFHGVTPRTLTDLADSMRVERHPAGTRIIQQGDPGNRFYLIREGRVAVLSGRAAVRIAELGPGDHFGETALLTGQPRNAHVDALTDVVLYSLESAAFHRAMNSRATMDEEVRSTLFGR